MNQIRVLIADDHDVVRRGLILVLRQEADLQVVGEACDGTEVLAMLEHGERPDVALLDWKMPRLDGLQTARHVKSIAPNVRTLILTGAPIEDAALDSLEEGVDGFVHKDVSPAGLMHAIRQVAAGKRYLGSEIGQALLERSRQSLTAEEEPCSLSPRELEVLALMATVATYKEIALKLGISESTVHTYVRRIFSKLDQPNRTQAVLVALQRGLISVD
ncbi:MAG TPA: response regulator transcription factor [Candidatus Binatia bacterium]|nr:response regulator transcription factor [Candidatus Binatia bacterium]